MSGCLEATAWRGVWGEICFGLLFFLVLTFCVWARGFCHELNDVTKTRDGSGFDHVSISWLLGVYERSPEAKTPALVKGAWR